MDTISNFLCVEKMGWSDAYHDGLGVWLCTRQLDDSKFHGLGKQLNFASAQTGLTINQEQFNALINGLPWHNLGKEIITLCL